MTNTIKRILVPIDFGSASEFVVGYAVRLAQQLGASIDLLHVVENPFLSGAWSPEIYVPDLEGILQAQSDEATREIATFCSAPATYGIEIGSRVLLGLPAPAIVEHATTANIDLIVMATHGRTGLAHVVLGSVAERVLRHAPCAVLTVKAPAASQADSRGSVASATVIPSGSPSIHVSVS